MAARPGAPGASATSRPEAPAARAALLTPAEGSERRRSDERLRRDERLRLRRDFARCYRDGRRRRGSWAILYYVANDLDTPRFGMTASRKTGGAVVRQRLRRRAREIFRRWPGRPSLPPLDLVVHFLPRAGQAEFAALEADLVSLFESLLPHGGAAGSRRS